MRILLDECVPARLARLLPQHSIATVPRRGWAGIKNGRLLSLAAEESDLFLTVDRRIAVQQDLSKFSIAVLLVRSPSNRLNDLRPLVPAILEKLAATSPGTLSIVQKSRGRG